MATDQKQFSKLGAACYQGDLETAAKLLKKLHPDAYPYNANGDSLLMAAIRNDKLDVVKLLVDAGASFAYQAPHGGTPLTFALEYDRQAIIEYLASRGAPIAYTPVSELPQDAKDAKLFEVLEDWYSDQTPPRIAALLAAGADPNARRDGDTPMHALAKRSASNKQLYAALLDGGADPALADADGNTVLHLLAHGASATDAAKLVIRKLPVDTRGAGGKTALHVAAGAAYWNALDFVKLLVKLGADPMLKDDAGRAPADHAKGGCKAWLLEQTMPPIAEQDRSLLAAVARGELARVQELCEAGANPSVVDTSGKDWGPNNQRGVAAIHVAMNKRLPHEVAMYLMSRDVDVAVRDLEGRTALHHVLDLNEGEHRAELVEQLLAKGADPDAVDDRDQTPVFQLTSFYQASGEPALLERLRAAGANLGHAAHGSQTILDDLYEKCQRFSEINDKPGFVALIEKVIELEVSTADPAMRKQVDSWLATKGARFSSRPQPAAAEPEPPKLAIDLAPAGKLGVGYLDLEGQPEIVALFDWIRLESEAADGDSEDASTIWEYHIHPALEEPVREHKLVPFGVVGLAYPEYAEISTYGTLFAIASRAQDRDAPVLFIPNTGTVHRLTENDEPRELPLSFQQLLATFSKKGEKPPAKKSAAKQSAAKPANKSAAKPAKRPAAKPANKSAAKPAKQPTRKQAARSSGTRTKKR